jgi:hypothetical protein
MIHTTFEWSFWRFFFTFEMWNFNGKLVKTEFSLTFMELLEVFSI